MNNLKIDLKLKNFCNKFAINNETWYSNLMKLFGRNLIQIGQLAGITRNGADMRSTGIDPTWSHIQAQPTLLK